MPPSRWHWGIEKSIRGKVDIFNRPKLSELNIHILCQPALVLPSLVLSWKSICGNQRQCQRPWSVIQLLTQTLQTCSIDEWTWQTASWLVSFTTHPVHLIHCCQADHVRPHNFRMKPEILHLCCEALYARSPFLTTLFSFLVSTPFILPFMNCHTCYAPAPHAWWSFHFNASSEKFLLWPICQQLHAQLLAKFSWYLTSLPWLAIPSL